MLGSCQTTILNCPLRHEEQLPPPGRLCPLIATSDETQGGREAEPTGGLSPVVGRIMPPLRLARRRVTVAANGQHVAVVEQSVESGGCDDRIGKHRAPFGDRYRRLAVADPNKA